MKILKQFVMPIIIGFLLAVIAIQNFPQFFRNYDTQDLVLPESAPIKSNSSDNIVMAPKVDSYYRAVAVAAPAVVNIYTTKVVEQRINPFFSDPFFSDFFDQQGLFNRKRRESSLGSGVILTQDGLVLTNNHVIKDATEIKVALHDGREVFAKLIGSDEQTDIAVLKLNLANLPTLKLANSSNLRIGDVVLAIGNPFGIGQTVTQGIISALGRTGLSDDAFAEFIQTDAAINPGNSGGALINTKGELVGINTMIYSKSGGYQGIGFAIPSLLATKVMRDLVEKGQVVRGWIGVELKEITPRIMQALELNSNKGLLITGIWRNSPAQKAGVMPGDILLELNGQAVTNAELAIHEISNIMPKEAIELKLQRKNKIVNATLKVTQKPKNLGN